MLRRLRLPALLLAFSASLACAQADLLWQHRFLPANPGDTSGKAANPDAAFSQRKVYWDDDTVGQFVVRFLKTNPTGRAVKAQLLDAKGAELWAKDFGPCQTPKIELLLKTAALKPGAYTLRAVLTGEPPVQVETTFTREKKSLPAVPFPAAGLPLRVQPLDIKTPQAEWPIGFGLPFPQNCFTDVNRLALFEDGKEVPLQIERAETWTPEAPGAPASARWAILHFIARYQDGKPRAYLLKLADAQRKPESRVKVNQTDAAIQVDTGRLRFEVNRKAFNGIAAAWLDADADGRYTPAEQLLSGGEGPYLVDQAGIKYSAARDAQVDVKVEEHGLLRAVILAQGWYANPDAPGDKRLCKFQTRLYAHAGQPFLQVEHRTTLTCDTDKVQFADIGFGLAAPGATAWAAGLDGKTLSGPLPKDGALSLHQYRHNKARLTNAAQVIEGAKGDGWFSLLRPAAPSATVLLRDFWQKFPKEFELSAGAATLHFWPRNGFDSWTREETVSRRDIDKLLFHHQGKLLDLRFPDYAYDALKAQSWGQWDPEGTAEMAKNGNGQGLSISNEFCIRLHTPAEADLPAQAALYRQAPHAMAEGAWNAASEVEGRLAASDPAAFPKIEEDINSFFPDYMKAVVDAAGEYGMWIYANTHNNWDPANLQPDLHRVWQASHYRHVTIPWLLYFRGGPFDILPWARANTDHYMNIDTFTYTDEHSRALGHVYAGMMHAKGFTPWGAPRAGQKSNDLRNHYQGHFINPDAYLFAWRIDGNLRARELHRNWAATLKSANPWAGASRETNTVLGEALNYYRATWDPDALPWIHFIAENMLSMPMEKMNAPFEHPVWHQSWYDRLYTLTRDERVKAALLEYAKTLGRRYPKVMAFAWQQTGDKELLEVNMGGVVRRAENVYRNPDDPVSGYRAAFAAHSMRPYLELPYWLQALKDAGIKQIEVDKPVTIYPTGVDVIALEPEDRDFTVRLESVPGRDVHPPTIRIYSPSGKVLANESLARDKNPKAKLRYVGNDALTFPIPRDGETGLYRIEIRSYEVIFKAPYTDLPVEGAVAAPEQNYRIQGGGDFYILPVAAKGELTTHWGDFTMYARYSGSYVLLKDAAGKTLLDTTLLAGSKRPTAVATLSADTPAPWSLHVVNGIGTNFRWSGALRMLLMAPDRRAVEQLLPLAEKLAAPRK